MFQRALGGRMRRGVLVLAGGTALAQLIVLASYPIISRLYLPDEFGAAAGLLAVVSILLPIACLTYDHAVPLPTEDRTVTNLLALSACIASVLALGLGLVFLLAGGLVARLVADGQLAGYLWLIALAVLFGGLTLALTGAAIRSREFGAISDSRIAQSIGVVTTQVGAGFAGMNGGGLVLGDAVGRGIGFLRLSSRMGRLWRRGAVRPTRAGIGQAASRYRRFPLLGSVPNVMQGLVLEAPLLLLIGLYGPTVGGNFALAQRLVLAPVALIVVSVGQVFISESAAQMRADPAGLRSLFTGSLRQLVRSGVPLLPLLAISGIVLVPLIFGEPWRDAGIYLAVLSPLYVLQLMTSPFGGILDVLERQDLLLVREVLRAALLVGSVVFAWSLGLSALWAVVAVSIAGTIAYAAYGGISWYAVTRSTA